MKVERSIDIDASPEAVWPYMTEPDRILQWCITFRRFEYTGEQRSGAGTPFYVEEKVGGPVPLMRLNFAITGWAENERVAFKMTSGNLMKSYEQSWTVEAAPSGGRFTFFEEVELPFGPVGRLMGLFAARQSAATAEKMLEKLKALAEA